MTLIGLTSASAPPTAKPATDATLPLLVTRGKAPAAALLAREAPWSTTTPGAPAPPPDRQRTQRPLWHFAHANQPAADATAPDTDGNPAPATSTASDNDGAATRIRRTDHFRAGSITKTFIATAILQLAAEPPSTRAAPTPQGY